MGTRRHLQKALERWYPTLVRYAGLGLLVYAVVVDRLRNPAILPAVVAMILFRNVLGSNGQNGNQK